MSDIRIVELTTVEEVARLIPLVRDYITFVTAQIRDAAGVTLDADAMVASTASKLHDVIPPRGRTFEARRGEVPVGMVFVRPSGGQSREIKRLYVAPEARGTGLGRQLVSRCIDAAREDGAASLRLDSTKSLTGAIALYADLGFEHRGPYAESDHADDELMLPHLVFMELRI
ncbi:MAG: GNAT family N-acetyltransferase [Pseudomonadota bacterium]